MPANAHLPPGCAFADARREQREHQRMKGRRYCKAAATRASASGIGITCTAALCRLMNEARSCSLVRANVRRRLEAYARRHAWGWQSHADAVPSRACQASESGAGAGIGSVWPRSVMAGICISLHGRALSGHRVITKSLILSGSMPHAGTASPLALSIMGSARGH